MTAPREDWSEELDLLRQIVARLDQLCEVVDSQGSVKITGGTLHVDEQRRRAFVEDAVSRTVRRAQIDAGDGRG